MDKDRPGSIHDLSLLSLTRSEGRLEEEFDEDEEGGSFV